jgi:hypothetical protein
MENVNIVNLIAVVVATAVAAAIPALLPRLPLPGVVLEIVIGAIIGPQVLGLVHPGATMSYAVLVLILTTSILGPVLTERFEPRLVPAHPKGSAVNPPNGVKGYD